MYYALADLQNGGNLMATGRNCTSVEKVKDELLSYLSNDFGGDEDEATIRALPPQELFEMYEFELLAQPTKFDENY